LSAEQPAAISVLITVPKDEPCRATSSQLDHLVGCNGFFSSLIREARAHSETELAQWWSSRRCAAAWGEAVRPDGYAVWVDGERRVPFHLEFDMGTERLARHEAKLPGYAELARAAGHPTWVLFCFRTAGRESAARRVLSHPAVPVATAVLSPGQAANGPHWSVVGEIGPRLGLADLGSPERSYSVVQKL
jgi:hypothetical protein